MDILPTLLQFIVGYGSLALVVWAFVDAFRFDKADFKAIDKMPRLFWLIALGVAFALFLWLGALQFDDPFSARSLTWVAGLVVVAVYFWDLRPKLQNAQIARQMGNQN